MIHTIDDIPTPAVVIDAAVAQENILRLARYAAEHELKLRPHAKTHKSLAMARMQVAAGVTGLAVATVGEAEIMTEAADDVLVAYPAFDPHRAGRIADLARHRTMRVAVDSAMAVDALDEAAGAAGSTIGILVDLDVGFHRTGVGSPDSALGLAKHVDEKPNVRLDGLFCYPGHINTPPDQQELLLQGVQDLLTEALGRWRQHGLKANIVSGGSTPTAYQSHLVPALTEIRPGTYIYNDANTVARGCCTQAQCAARAVATVVSDAVPGRVVIDAGSKTLTRDPSSGTDGGFGVVVDFPGAKLARLTEEHGEIDVSGCDRPPRLGTRLSVIPNHICPCINLHDSVWLTEDDQLRPLCVDARGSTI